jgi:hypothetical protein
VPRLESATPEEAAGKTQRSDNEAVDAGHGAPENPNRVAENGGKKGIQEPHLPGRKVTARSLASRHHRVTKCAAAATFPRICLFSATAYVSYEPQRPGDLEIGSAQTPLYFENHDGVTICRGDISTGEGQRKDQDRKYISKYHKNNKSDIQEELN